MPFTVDSAVACDTCGRPATHRDIATASATCDACVAHDAGQAHGEQFACAYALGDAAARAALAGLTRDALIEIIDGALNAPGDRFEWDAIPAVTAMDKTADRYFEDRSWLDGLEPQAEDGTAS